MDAFQMSSRPTPLLQTPPTNVHLRAPLTARPPSLPHHALPLFRQQPLVGVRIPSATPHLCNKIKNGFAVWIEIPFNDGSKYFDCEDQMLKDNKPGILQVCTRVITIDYVITKTEYIDEINKAVDNKNKKFLKNQIVRIVDDIIKHENGKAWIHKFVNELKIDLDLPSNGMVFNYGTKIVAIGSIYGDLNSLVKRLKVLNMINYDVDLHNENMKNLPFQNDTWLENYKWDGGNNMLVQTGNLVWSGDHSKEQTGKNNETDEHSKERTVNNKEVIDFFLYMAKEAAKNGGQVINLIGNEEVLLFENAVENKEYSKNTQQYEKYKDWLQTLPLMIYEIISQTIFSHGCVTQAVAKRGVELTNSAFGKMWSQGENKPKDLFDKNVFYRPKPGDFEFFRGFIWNIHLTYQTKPRFDTQRAEIYKKISENFEILGKPIETMVCDPVVEKDSEIQYTFKQDIFNVRFLNNEDMVYETNGSWSASNI